ncbi:MAG: pyrroline-5-carboxylate reductase [Steroidobacteraceae bacterium]|jgi:pyrroline-5-carboxylate reductase
MKQLRVGVIGGGNMARALIEGLLRQGLPAGQIRVGEPLAEQCAALESTLGVEAGANNDYAIAGADVVLLAVKPQQLPAVAQALRPTLDSVQPVFISIAAGIRLAQLAAWRPHAPLVRAMPNRPALVGAGVTGLYALPEVSATQRALAEQTLSAVGRTVWVRSEAELDVVTALSGSGPAYFFLLAEQLAAAGVALGLAPETAQLLARETLHGAGALTQSGLTLAAERAAVTSKGGTTEAALEVFARADLAGLVQRAVAAATRRGAELAELATRNR